MSASDAAWRVTYRIGFRAARLWWRLRPTDHAGALVAVEVGGKLLFVASSYRREWGFPGGGVQPEESPETAARRELNEEIGLTATGLIPAGIIRGNWDFRREQVHIFRLRMDHLPPLQLDNRETVAARLFGPDEIGNLRMTGPVGQWVRQHALAQ